MDDNKKRLRDYLKAYRRNKERAAYLERELAVNKTTEKLRLFLTVEKEAAERHCVNVHTIFYYLPESGLVRDVMTRHYIDGKSLKQIAGKLGYSCGYIANVNAATIAELAEDKAVLQLIKQP